MINEALDYLILQPVIALDTETTGLNPFTDEFLSIQLGDYHRQFLIDPKDLDKLRDLFSRPHKFVIHNAKFDLGFLRARGIVIHDVFDTMLAERVLTTGTYKRIGLDACLKKYFGVEVDKGIRDRLQDLGINHPEFAKYALDDIKYLIPLMEEQLNILQEENLLACIDLENKFVPVLTYIEHCGFKLNASKWREKLKQDKEEEERTLQVLDEVAELYGVKAVRVLETFFGPETERVINWSSSDQVCDVFESLGIKVVHYDKKAKEYKRTVQEKFIVGQDHPIIPVYLEYQKAVKRLTTYGLNYLKALSQYPDGRLRAGFKQIMNTGRLSCGSGAVNLQNIPAVPEGRRSRAIYERQCFEPEEGNVLITADYASQESRILASQSEEPRLLEFYFSGEADLHSFVTKLVFAKEFPEIKNMSLKEIKDKFPAQRQAMKGFNFALAYGGNANTVSENLGIPLEDAQKYEKQYYEAFPDLKKYFEKQAETCLKRGYIITNDCTKRKIYFPHYDEYINQRKALLNIAGVADGEGFLGFPQTFWDVWTHHKKQDNEFFNETLKPNFSAMMRVMSKMKNNSLNYPIQGTAADMTKSALISFYHNCQLFYRNRVKIVNVVHDEIVVECPERLKDEVAKLLVSSMKKAGSMYSTVPMDADFNIGKSWEH